MKHVGSQSANRNPKFQIGFTLIELVFVMAILGIILAVSMPRFAATGERLRTEQAAAELSQLFRYARERAVAQSAEIVWVWDGDARRARLQAVGDNGSAQWLEERSAMSASLSDKIGVRLERDGAPADRVRFLPDGTSEPTTLYLTRNQDAYTVTVDGATGQTLLSTRPAAR